MMKWTFAPNDVVLNDTSFNHAKCILLEEPSNVIANTFVAMSLLERGMLRAARISSKKCRDYYVEGRITNEKTFVDGDNRISLSTLCLFVSVLMGAMTEFFDFSITDMLTFTQEAIRRAAGVPTDM